LEKPPTLRIGRPSVWSNESRPLTSLLERLIVDHKLLEDPAPPRGVTAVLTIAQFKRRSYQSPADGILTRRTRIRVAPINYIERRAYVSRAVDVLKDSNRGIERAPIGCGRSADASSRRPATRLATIFSNSC